MQYRPFKKQSSTIFLNERAQVHGQERMCNAWPILLKEIENAWLDYIGHYSKKKSQGASTLILKIPRILPENPVRNDPKSMLSETSEYLNNM